MTWHRYNLPQWEVTRIMIIYFIAGKIDSYNT